MPTFTSPSGSKEIVLKKDEDLELFLEDFEPGSREFDLNIVVRGENAQLKVHGIAQTKNRDEKKWRIRITLAGKNQNAELNLRGVADDDSLLKFDGNGIVGETSEEGEISISEKIVLFSEKARGHALPVLRVETDNVNGASHAATIAPFDEEMFFYLESRGIKPQEGKDLLLEGFLRR